MFEKMVEEVMVNINQRPKGEIAVMMATHNEDTVRYVINKYASSLCNNALMHFLCYLRHSLISNLIFSGLKTYEVDATITILVNELNLVSIFLN